MQDLALFNLAARRPLHVPRVPVYSEDEERLLRDALSALVSSLFRSGAVGTLSPVLTTYLRLAMHGDQRSRVDLIFCGASSGMLGHEVIMSCDAGPIIGFRRHLVQRAASSGAAAVVVAYRVAGVHEPTEAHYAEAQSTRNALELAGVRIINFFIVSDAAAFGTADLSAHDTGATLMQLEMASFERVERAIGMLAARRHGPVLKTSSDVLAYVRETDRPAQRALEAVWLDVYSRVAGTSILALGNAAAVAELPRAVVAAALEHNARSVVLVDRDPLCRTSGGESSESLLSDLRAVLQLVGVSVLDCLVGQGNDMYLCRPGAAPPCSPKAGVA